MAQSSPHFADFGIAQGKNQEGLKPFGNESWWSSLGSVRCFSLAFTRLLDQQPLFSRTLASCSDAVYL